MFTCQVTGIAQEMDFEENVTRTFLLVELPNGARIRAAIDEDAAAQVVALSVQTKGQPRPALAPPPPSAMQRPAPAAHAPAMSAQNAEQPIDDEGDDVRVFGGADTDDSPTYEEEGEPEELAPPVQAPAAPPARREPQRDRKGNLVVPAKTVPKDNAGYPIVQNGGVDPNDLVGGRDQDEDGVGSV